MEIMDAPQAVVKQTEPIVPKAQPVAALADLDPVLDDAAVRQALVNAEANNVDPMTVTLNDLVAGQSKPSEPAKAPEPVAAIPLDVPEKFLKPDGEVDVEKIQASTRQLDEAIQKKEEKISKTIDEYMQEYRARETKFRNLPNADKLAAQLPPAPTPVPQPSDVSQMSNQELEAIVRRDYAADPIATTARLIELAIQKRFEPFEAQQKDSTIRGNIEALAKTDARVLRPDVFAAINQKLNSDPDYWRLKNPHKAAWLEVKEEMRLGDAPNGAQAQPSRMPSPVLGGGTPPSAPSATVPNTPQNVLSNLHKLDLKDRRQEAMGDEAIRAFLSKNR